MNNRGTAPIPKPRISEIRQSDEFLRKMVSASIYDGRSANGAKDSNNSSINNSEELGSMIPYEYPATADSKNTAAKSTKWYLMEYKCFFVLILMFFS
jgi:hypothetical protein